jgi:ribosomal protein S11
MCGLKGAHRGTLEAGTRAASAIAAVALRSGFRQVVLNLKGFGRGREPAFRSIVASGLKVLKIAVCSLSLSLIHSS